ncbi:C4-dicarboxylate ABC transporter [Betaproteobacteria bacterium]|nr:C4-dicarboxylate ABC transporter [Betaproteobacteria bacterium]
MSLVRKSILVLASILSAVVFMTPVQANAAAKKMVLRLAHEMPENHPYHAGALKFAEILSKKTNDEIAVQVYPNGTMGKQTQLVESLVMGTVDLALTNTVVMERYVPEMAVLVMPYVIRGWDHLYKVVDGEIGAELNKKLEAKGIVLLAQHETGTTNIHSKMSIRKPADIKGVKTRVFYGPSYAEVGKALGCIITTMSFSEVYSALQLGTIDAQFMSGSNVLLSKFYEVGKYYNVNELGFFLEPLSMSKMVFDRMSPAHQKAIKEAAWESAVWQRPYARAEQAKDLETLEKERGLIVYRPNEEEKAEWAKVIEPVYQKFPEWLPLINRIREVK